MGDLTVGNSRKQIFLFAIPVFIGNLFQNLYSIVDIIIVGRFLGVDALASVSMTSSISTLAVGWIIGMTSGFGVLLAQAFGAKDIRRLKHYMAMSTLICIGFSIIMTVVLLNISEWILQLLNTPDELFYDSKQYIEIIYSGLSITMLYNMLASVARALGDSKTPLYFLILASIINVVFDIVFVVTLSLGVAGVGYATVLAQAISAIMCLIYVCRKYPEIHFGIVESKVKIKTIYELMCIGIPMALQFSITSIGNMMLQSSLNLLGAIYIASYTATSKIQGILIQFSVAIGASVANFVGQNYGAKKIDRVKQGVKDGILLVVLANLLAMGIGWNFCPYLIQVFIQDVTTEMQQISAQMVHINIWFYIPLGLIFVYRNALQGLGNGVIPMIGGVCELITRVLVIYFLFDALQFVGICLADPLAWVSALIPLIFCYYWKIRRIE